MNVGVDVGEQARVGAAMAGGGLSLILSFWSSARSVGSGVRVHTGGCDALLVLLQVDFWVTLQVTGCLPEPHLLRLWALGFSEELVVELSTACDCNCSDTQPQAPHCSAGHGDLQCGICR